MAAKNRSRERAAAWSAVAAAVAVLSAAGCADVGSDDEQGGGDGAQSRDGGPGSDAGGGDGEIARCVEKSGARLEAVVLDHGGDDADLLRFTDTEYGGAECSFRVAADGTLRCLPLGSSTAVFAGASRVWTDAGCSSPIGEVSYEGTPASFAVYDGPVAASCGAPAVEHFYQAGSRLPYDGTQTVYERDYFTGACVGRNAYFNRSYYTFGEEIPATSFVFGLELQSTGGRLVVRSVEGEDGSRSCDHFAFRDRERDEACTLSSAEDGAERCLPGIGFQATFFTDAACSTGAVAATAQQSACAAENPRYIQAPVTGCFKGRVLYKRGALAPGQFFYMSGACTPLEAGFDLFPVGAHVPPSKFIELAEERHDAGNRSRLQRVDLVGGGARIHRDLWFDPQLDSDCWFRRTENGTWRCVPLPRPGAPVGNRSAVRDGYSDAACTAAVQAAAEDCSGAAPRYIVDSSDSSRVYPVGTELAGFYQKGATCVAMTGAWYQVGAALSFDDLVSAFESTR